MVQTESGLTLSPYVLPKDLLPPDPSFVPGAPLIVTCIDRRLELVVAAMMVELRRIMSSETSYTVRNAGGCRSLVSPVEGSRPETLIGENVAGFQLAGFVILLAHDYCADYQMRYGFDDSVQGREDAWSRQLIDMQSAAPFLAGALANIQCRKVPVLTAYAFLDGDTVGRIDYNQVYGLE